MTTADDFKPDEELAEEGVSLSDFHAYMPMHNYIYAPSREPWPAASVNARLPPMPLVDQNGKPVLDKTGNQKTISASAWLDRNQPVEQMTWAPGLPMLIHDRLISDGGWIERQQVTCFNLYRPPIIEPGNPAEAGPWIEHMHATCSATTPSTSSHGSLSECSARKKRSTTPSCSAVRKGIGKDTLLEPVKYAVGPWNFHEVSPQHMLGRFNGFLRSVILRVNEARDLGDVNRFQFYDHMKTYTRSAARCSARRRKAPARV